MRRARKSIAAFKLREGNPVGVAVTLRGDRGYEFLDRLISIAIPRIRDFRGLNPRSFDGRGNYSMGVREQIIFPEIDYDAIDQVRGLDITITTSAATDAEAFALLAAFGLPFSADRRPRGFETLDVEPARSRRAQAPPGLPRRRQARRGGPSRAEERAGGRGDSAPRQRPRPRRQRRGRGEAPDAEAAAGRARPRRRRRGAERRGSRGAPRRRRGRRAEPEAAETGRAAEPAGGGRAPASEDRGAEAGRRGRADEHKKESSD